MILKRGYHLHDLCQADRDKLVKEAWEVFKDTPTMEDKNTLHAVYHIQMACPACGNTLSQLPYINKARPTKRIVVCEIVGCPQYNKYYTTTLPTVRMMEI